MGSRGRRYGIRATLLVLVYLAVAIAPLPLNLIQLDPSRGFVINFSVALGFVGLSVLTLQFVLAARIHTVTAPYGIDRVLQSLLVQRVGTDVCSLRPVPHRAGPVKCHRHVRSHRAAREPGLSRVSPGAPYRFTG